MYPESQTERAHWLPGNGEMICQKDYQQHHQKPFIPFARGGTHPSQTQEFGQSCFVVLPGLHRSMMLTSV